MNEKHIKHPVLDPKTVGYLKSLAEGENPTFVRDFVELFLSHTPSLIQRLQERVAAGDAEGVEKTAHRLRGSSLNLGAVALGEVCQEIEERGREGQLEQLEPLVEKMLEAFLLAKEELLALA